MGGKTVTIKKGDLVEAMVDLMQEDEHIRELVSKSAMSCLILPCIAIKLEKQLGLLE